MKLQIFMIKKSLKKALIILFLAAILIDFVFKNDKTIIQKHLQKNITTLKKKRAD